MGIRFDSVAVALAPLMLLFIAFSAYGQSLRERLQSIQNTHFEIVGAEDFGNHKSSRTPQDTLSLIVVYAPTKFVQEPFLSEFVPKVKSKLTESESFVVYFLDDRSLARDLFHLLQSDGYDEGKLDAALKSTKALFVCIKNDKKEFLRLFGNGMTERDFDALDLELNN